MTSNDAKNSKKLLKFSCDFCDFVCSNKQDYTRHLSTRKHKMMTNNDAQYSNEYICLCGKKYKYRQGLSIHKKTCTFVEETEEKTYKNDDKLGEFQLDKELLIKLLLKNQDIMEGVLLKNQDVMEKMMEIMPKLGNNSHNNITNNNTTNNQFNIQMFLNEHCKNAMNLTDFIDSLPITAATYDSTIQNGLTKTLTNMITNGLSQLDILERPIHCTDATRKTLYVKEANNWEKDTELLRILLGIRNLARKQRTMISEWKDVNEGWETDDNIQTKLTTLICHSMTDIENDEKETSKIIRAISKNVYLDNEAKQQYIK
jgi:hypothetical protein